MKEVTYYRKENGETPFTSWLDKLDKKLQSKIIAKTINLQVGNYTKRSKNKNCKWIKNLFYLRT